MSSAERWPDLNPPPEVLALGTPDRVDLRTRAGWSADGWLARLAGGTGGGPLFTVSNDSRLVGGLALLAVGLVCVVLGLVARAKAPPVVLQVLFGGGVFCLFGGAGLLLTRRPADESADRAADDTESDAADEPRPGRPLTGVQFAFGFFPEAVAHTNGKGWVVVRYDEVVEYRGPCPGRHVAELDLEDGRTVTLRESNRDFLNDFPVLAEVERRLFPYLRARVEHALGAGETVAFGPVGLSRDGLTYRGRTVGWAEIKQVEVASPGTTTYWAGGTADSRDVRLLVALYEGGPRPSVLWGTLGQSASEWWIEERFLPLPNRAVLLTALAAHRSVGVSHAVGLFMPWNPRAA